MIINCKGTKIGNRLEKCAFLYAGNWGDSELIEHQKYHESLGDESHYWLGFDSSQPFGKYSMRDGKRI